jgi:hypothetical protein
MWSRIHQDKITTKNLNIHGGSTVRDWRLPGDRAVRKQMQIGLGGKMGHMKHPGLQISL